MFWFLTSFISQNPIRIRKSLVSASTNTLCFIRLYYEGYECFD